MAIIIIWICNQKKSLEACQKKKKKKKTTKKKKKKKKQQKKNVKHTYFFMFIELNCMEWNGMNECKLQKQ